MKKEIITHKEPKSPISEIFRALRTNIQFSNAKEEFHSLLITSTIANEGKSWVASNLAVAFAQAGKKVILVDCDMRKGRQFSIFDVAPTPGLSNFLSGINSDGRDSNSNIVTYIKETEVENLYLIPAGNIPPNPSELLSSNQMEQMIEQLETICDIVIFDGTPSLLVTDTVIVSRYVDTTLIVSTYKKSKIEDVKRVKRDIENVGGKIAGVIINKMPVSKKSYYDTYYYGNTSLTVRTKKTAREEKQEQELEIERKKQELKEKSKNIVKQNKEEQKETKRYEWEQNTQPKVDSSKTDVTELLKQVKQYVDEEKEKLKRGEKEND